MKPVILFALILLVHPVTAQSKDEQAIRQLLAEQTIAWNKGDLDGFMKGYWQDDSLAFIGKNGINHGWATTLNNYKRGYPDTVAMGKLQFTISQVKRLSPEYYHVIGRWHLQRRMGDMEGSFTLLLRKIREKWLIVIDHSS